MVWPNLCFYKIKKLNGCAKINFWYYEEGDGMWGKEIDREAQSRVNVRETASTRFYGRLVYVGLD